MSENKSVDKFDGRETPETIKSNKVPEHTETITGKFFVNILDERELEVTLSSVGIGEMFRLIRRESEEEAKTKGEKIGEESADLDADKIKSKSSEAIGEQDEILDKCKLLENFFQSLSQENKLLRGTTGVFELTHEAENYVEKYFRTVANQEESPTDSKSENSLADGEEKRDGRFCFVISKSRENEFKNIIEGPPSGTNFQIVKSNEKYMALNLNGVKVLIAFPVGEVREQQAKENENELEAKKEANRQEKEKHLEA